MHQTQSFHSAGTESTPIDIAQTLLKDAYHAARLLEVDYPESAAKLLRSAVAAAQEIKSSRDEVNAIADTMLRLQAYAATTRRSA